MRRIFQQKKLSVLIIFSLTRAEYGAIMASNRNIIIYDNSKIFNYNFIRSIPVTFHTDGATRKLPPWPEKLSERSTANKTGGVVPSACHDICMITMILLSSHSPSVEARKRGPSQTMRAARRNAGSQEGYDANQSQAGMFPISPGAGGK